MNFLSVNLSTVGNLKITDRKFQKVMSVKNEENLWTQNHGEEFFVKFAK